MSKKYEEITGFVPLDELNEDEDLVMAGATVPVCVVTVIGLTIKVLTAVACETGACTGQCNS